MKKFLCKNFVLLILVAALLTSCTNVETSTESKTPASAEESSSTEIFASDVSLPITSTDDSSQQSSEEESSVVSEEPSSSTENDSSVEDNVTIESAAERFADKFTDGEVIQTDTSYQSSNVNVTLKEITYEGKVYFVQDIYIKKIESFSIGFAGLKFGAKYNDYVFNMVEDYRNAGHNVVGAINGDYCNLNMKKLIIRNGKLYRTGKYQYTICVLYKNGIMKAVPKKDFDPEVEIENGAWHAWDFGPSFLAEDGSALTTFKDRTSVSGRNPRTAIGYYEPGHYCFITIGGRKSAYGVTFKEMSAFANSLGCKMAYNLDGGDSAVMVFGDRIVNEEYQGQGRKITDIVFIADLPAEE